MDDTMMNWGTELCVSTTSHVYTHVVSERCADLTYGKHKFYHAARPLTLQTQFLIVEIYFQNKSLLLKCDRVRYNLSLQYINTYSRKYFSNIYKFYFTSQWNKYIIKHSNHQYHIIHIHFIETKAFISITEYLTMN